MAFPFHSCVNRGTEREKKKGIGGETSTTSRSERIRRNFRNIGRNIPIPRIIASLSCKPALRSRSGDRLYARFVFRKRVAQRGICSAPLTLTLSKYSQYLPPFACPYPVELRIIASIHPSPGNFATTCVSKRKNIKKVEHVRGKVHRGRFRNLFFHDRIPSLEQTRDKSYRAARFLQWN